MTSLASVRRFGAAGLLATTVLLGTTTSTLGDPASACAEPKFDRGGYNLCQEIAGDQFRRGEITQEEMLETWEWCCTQYGGEWVLVDGGGAYCADPAEDNEYPAPPGGPGQLPQIPGPTEATKVPPPPPPGNTAAQLPTLPPVQTR